VLSLITVFTILMYILFSTIFHNYSLVGVIGQGIGVWNIKIFGSLAYIDFLFIIIPLYVFYRYPKLKYSIEPYIGWLLFLVSILLLQILTLGANNSGILSYLIYSSMLPYIGVAGLWFLFFLTSILSVSLIIQRDILDILQIFNLNYIEYFKNIKQYLIDSFNKLFRAKDNQKFKNCKPLKNSQNIEKPKKNLNTTVNTPKKSEPKESIIEITPPPTLDSSKVEEVESKESLECEKKAQKKEGELKVKILNELEENKKLLEQLDKGEVEKPKNFILPKLEFLQKPKKINTKVNEAEIDRKIKELLEKLKLFKIDGDVVNTYTGPIVTTFEFKPAPHVKVSKILNLQDDLAMALSAETIRIQAPIPGRDVV